MKNILTVVIILCYCLNALAQPKYGHSIYNGQSEISFTISNPILELELKYQSGQKEKGIFGLGWTADIEKNIIAVGDGTYLMKSICDCPGKKENYSFVPLGWEAKKLAAVVNQMIPLLDNKYKKEALLSNYELRFELLQNLIKSGKWKAPRQEPGQKFYAYEFPTISMEILKNGYKVVDDSINYYFDTKGKVEKAEQSKKAYNFKYNTNNQLIAIEDSLKGKIEFLYNKEGQIIKIQFENKEYFSAEYKDGKMISFIYPKVDYSLGIEDPFPEDRYTLSYEENNLVSALYGEYEVPLMQYKYNKKEQLSLKKENFLYSCGINPDEGITSLYRYEETSKDRLKKIGIEEIKFNHNVSSDTLKYLHEISFDINAIGREYLKYENTNGDGESRSRSYAEAGSCQILEQVNNGNKTHYTYNKSGQLTGKYNDKGAMVRAIYHPITQKLVQCFDSEDHSSWYQYDNKGNLIVFENSEGDKLELVYNERDEIILMQDLSKNKDPKSLYLWYNQHGNVVKIEHEGVGTMTIVYNNSGEVESVTSPEGNSVVLAITQAYQNLLNMVKAKELNQDAMSNRSGDNKFNYKSKLMVNGLIAVGEDSKWGYQDSLGNWKIPAIYDYASDFFEDYKIEGLAIVRKNQKYGVINLDGTIWLPLEYDYISVPKNGLVRVMKNGKWGFKSIYGSEFLAPKYDYMFDMDAYNGFAKVKIGSMWNVIKDPICGGIEEAKLIFNTNMNHISLLAHYEVETILGTYNIRLWRVEYNGKYGFYRESHVSTTCWNLFGRESIAKEILPIEYDYIYMTKSEFLLSQRAGVWKVCNLEWNGEIINISEDLVGYKNLTITFPIMKAEVENDKFIYGLINYEAKIIVSPKYERLEEFKVDYWNTKYYLYEHENKSGIINDEGKQLLDGADFYNDIVLYNNQQCYYYFTRDSIYLSCYDSLLVFKPKDKRRTIFIVKKANMYGLFEDNSYEDLHQLIPIEFEDIKIVSSHLALLKKKNFTLCTIPGKYETFHDCTLLKKIKNYSIRKFGINKDQDLYILNLQQGYYMITEEHDQPSPLFKKILPIENSSNYIVKTKKGYGIFNIESFLMIVPDEYKSIKESEGRFYGKKAGKEQLLEFND